MDKFDGKVLNALENLEKAGVITSTPADPFKYVADVYFNDGTEIILPFETMNKEDYRSAFRAVCEILDSGDEYKSHGKYIVGSIRENNDPDPQSTINNDEKFDKYLTDQNDTVDNAAMALINALSRTDATSWNMEYIGAVVDAAVMALRKYDIECCYPYYSTESIESEETDGQPGIPYGLTETPCYRDGILCDYAGDKCKFCQENALTKTFDNITKVREVK